MALGLPLLPLVLELILLHIILHLLLVVAVVESFTAAAASPGLFALLASPLLRCLSLLPLASLGGLPLSQSCFPHPADPVPTGLFLRLSTLNATGSTTLLLSSLLLCKLISLFGCKTLLLDLSLALSFSFELCLLDSLRSFSLQFGDALSFSFLLGSKGLGLSSTSSSFELTLTLSLSSLSSLDSILSFALSFGASKSDSLSSLASSILPPLFSKHGLPSPLSLNPSLLSLFSPLLRKSEASHMSGMSSSTRCLDTGPPVTATLCLDLSTTSSSSGFTGPSGSRSSASSSSFRKFLLMGLPESCMALLNCSTPLRKKCCSLSLSGSTLSADLAKVCLASGEHLLSAPVSSGPSCLGELLLAQGSLAKTFRALSAKSSESLPQRRLPGLLRRHGLCFRVSLRLADGFAFHGFPGRLLSHSDLLVQLFGSLLVDRGLLFLLSLDFALRDLFGLSIWLFLRSLLFGRRAAAPRPRFYLSLSFNIDFR